MYFSLEDMAYAITTFSMFREFDPWVLNCHGRRYLVTCTFQRDHGVGERLLDRFRVELEKLGFEELEHANCDGEPDDWMIVVCEPDDWDRKKDAQDVLLNLVHECCREVGGEVQDGRKAKV